MRNIVLATLVAAVWLSESAWAQELAPELVPPAVKQAVQARFPTAKAVAWKLKTDKNYEAEFTLKGTEIAAKFDATGKWLETESAISRSQVPKAVRTAGAKQFAACKVVERQTVQRCNEERLIYELHLEGAKEVLKVWLSADGAVLSQSAKPKPANSTKPEQ